MKIIPIKLRCKLNPPDNVWLARLDQHGFTRSTVFDQGQHEALKIKLLDIAGTAVALSVIEEDKNRIMSRGKLFRGYNAKMMKGRECQCHFNSSLLWWENQDDARIVTGYALSRDCLWRQHTWILDVRDNLIAETTTKRVLYFGFVMNPQECMDFYMENL